MADKEIVEPKFVQNKLTPDDERPYVVNTDDIEEAKLNCALCQEMPCCPEHCCDVREDEIAFVWSDYDLCLVGYLRMWPL